MTYQVNNYRSTYSHSAASTSGFTVVLARWSKNVLEKKRKSKIEDITVAKVFRHCVANKQH